MAKLGVSERFACGVLGQHRSTQRKKPTGRADEAGLTADIIRLAIRYGRYGYRRITAMLSSEGWTVNVKRVERIWRREGLKVPQKQPKKSRLWLNDGSCIRLRPERARAFDQGSSSPNIGAGAPISVAETKDAFEVTAELPGVDEKDIKVSLDENQLVISGEKKAESTKEEKDWHVVERSYGSFYRSMSLPFEPEDGAIDAHFDKGVLHLTIKKPAKALKVSKTISIKSGAPPSAER